MPIEMLGLIVLQFPAATGVIQIADNAIARPRVLRAFAELGIDGALFDEN